MDIYAPSAPLREISLFSGYGGFSLGLRLAGIPIRTIAYVEIDGYSQRIIQARIRDGQLDDAPIWDDIRTFDPSPWRGHCEIITGGFPCQDISVAGKGAGIDAGERSGLWREMVRVIGVIRPSYALLENVSAILVRGLDRVLGDLSEIGYDAVWTVVSAADAGASHKRARWFCLAYSQGQGADAVQLTGQWGGVESNGSVLAYPQADGQSRRGPAWAGRPGLADGSGDFLPEFPPGPRDRKTWAGILARWPELAPAIVADDPHRKERQTGIAPRFGDAYGLQAQSPVLRVVDGAPVGLDVRLSACRCSRVARLKALGNGICPPQAALAIRRLFAMLEEERG